MGETLTRGYGVNLDSGWNRGITWSWDKTQEKVYKQKYLLKDRKYCKIFRLFVHLIKTLYFTKILHSCDKFLKFSALELSP